MDKVKIAELIAEEWNREGIEYAVAHGIEGYPTRIGRDLDVFIHPKDVLRATNIAISTFRSMGVSKITTLRWDPWPRAGVMFAFESGVGWQLDLFTSLKWGPVTLVKGARPTRYYGPFKIDPWASFAKNILIKILGGVQPSNCRLEDFEDDIVQKQCRKLFGDDLALRFLQAVKREQWEYIWQLSPKLRMRAILRHFIFHPLLTFENCISWPIREVWPFMRRILPVCVLIGAEDSLAKQCVNLLETRDWFITKVEVKYIRHNWFDAGERFMIWKNLSRIAWSWLHFMIDNYLANTLKLVLYICSREVFRVENNQDIHLLDDFFKSRPKFDVVLIVGGQENLDKPLANYFEEKGSITAVVPPDAGPEEVAKIVESLCMEAFFTRHGYGC